jgi:N-acylglucosamine 2-epimerase
MKLWWPHTEALYARARPRPDRRAPLAGLARRIDAYSFKHFADPAHGEWFGYCDRFGNRTHDCKGGNYKGCFHVPRALLMCVQRIEATPAK